MRYSPPVFGLVFGAVLGDKRRAAEKTLRRLKGPQSRLEQLSDVAGVFTNYACCLTDAFLVGAGRGYAARTHATNDGEHFRQSEQQGRGVILATAHTAGWDVAGPLLSTRDSKEVIIVMEPERDRQAMHLHDDARSRAGIRIAHVGEDPLAALPLLSHLRRRKGVVAMKIDRTVPGMRSRSVRFLDGPWQIPEGILTLAAVSGAPIMPVFTRRLGFLEYEFVTAPPLSVPRKPTADELDASAQHLATLLEQFARANPHHWFRFSEI
ncbi:MAG: lysophospholipid acyltransferase family protein [Deltaproteobacteria bacterium]|nr:lysophospholipid acyltransferase family protein [Deltaproteobacteria bacterium]